VHTPADAAGQIRRPGNLVAHWRLGLTGVQRRQTLGGFLKGQSGVMIAGGPAAGSKPVPASVLNDALGHPTYIPK